MDGNIIAYLYPGQSSKFAMRIFVGFPFSFVVVSAFLLVRFRLSLATHLISQLRFGGY